MAADTEKPFVVGRRWQIVSLLARGGMGAVYVAKHRVTGRMAALKILDAAEAPADFQRFQREAQAASSIGHPGVVEVYDADFDSETGAPYLVMELLQGATLREKMDDPATTPEQLVDWLKQSLEPLAAAHDASIIHRDLKPDNLFVTSDHPERVKLLDFGIARTAGSVGVTQTGIGIGTPQYMSPEQSLDARSVTLATDCWAMGAMLYESICGAPPFDAESVNAIIVRICTEPARPIKEMAPEVSTPMADLVDRCLQQDPLKRPQDARELLDELERALRPRSLPAARLPSNSLRPPGAEESHMRLVSVLPTELPENKTLPRLAAISGLVLIAAAALGLLSPEPSTEVTALSWFAFIIGNGLLLMAWKWTHRGDSQPSPRPRAKVGKLGRSKSPAAEEKRRPTRGAAEAAIEVIFLTDLNDRRSQMAGMALSRLLQRYRRTVQMSLVQLPTGSRAHGWRVAEAAHEVREQAGDEAYWRYVDAQLLRPIRNRARAVEERLEELGLNMLGWRHSDKIRRHRIAVEEDVGWAAGHGILDGPAFMIGSRVLKGNTRFEVLCDVVDDLLAEQARAALTGSERTTNPHQLSDSGPIRLSQIVVHWSALSHAQLSIVRTRDQARELAATLLRRTRLPKADFEQLSRRFGDGKVELGHVYPEDLHRDLRRAALTLRVGEVSSVINTDHGFHILRRVG